LTKVSIQEPIQEHQPFQQLQQPVTQQEQSVSQQQPVQQPLKQNHHLKLIIFFVVWVISLCIYGPLPSQ
jgi:hypothetical protein